jgi:hypothetical protein
VLIVKFKLNIYLILNFKKMMRLLKKRKKNGKFFLSIFDKRCRE